MPPEQQVCTLSQAKQLRDLGILPLSTWYFTYHTNSPKYFINRRKTAEKQYAHDLKNYGDDSNLEMAAAFTLSELAVMLDIQQGWLVPEKLADELLQQLLDGTLTAETVNERLTGEEGAEED